MQLRDNHFHHTVLAPSTITYQQIHLLGQLLGLYVMLSVVSLPSSYCLHRQIYRLKVLCQHIPWPHAPHFQCFCKKEKIYWRNYFWVRQKKLYFNIYVAAYNLVNNPCKHISIHVLWNHFKRYLVQQTLLENASLWSEVWCIYVHIYTLVKAAFKYITKDHRCHSNDFKVITVKLSNMQTVLR